METSGDASFQVSLCQAAKEEKARMGAEEIPLRSKACRDLLGYLTDLTMRVDGWI